MSEKCMKWKHEELKILKTIQSVCAYFEVVSQLVTLNMYDYHTFTTSIRNSDIVLTVTINKIW